MIFPDEARLKERIKELEGRVGSGPLKIHSDTTNFMAVMPGDVLRLGGNDYYIRGHAVEGRFGIDEQPKFWVKYGVDLGTGERKVIKLVFYEDFTTRIGPFLLKAHRSPEKESRILDKTSKHPHFMHGVTIADESGNPVRIIDFVRGVNLYRKILRIKDDHETYFNEMLPGILEKLIPAFEAIAFLRDNGEQHGDIRNDHVIISADDERYVWIDFDYQVGHTDYDIWSLGNLFSFIIGKGSITASDTEKYPDTFPGLRQGARLDHEDALMVHPHRIANLKKLYPYIPEPINIVLKNFSVGTERFYEDMGTLISETKEAVSCL